MVRKKEKDGHVLGELDGVKYRTVGKEIQVITVAKTVTLPYTLFEFVAEMAISERLSFSSSLALLCQRGRAYMREREEEERKCRRKKEAIFGDMREDEYGYDEELVQSLEAL